MCALFPYAFWECICLGVVYGLAHDQRLRLNTKRKFGILRHLPPKVTEFLVQEVILYVLERTSFHFLEGYLAAKVTLGFDWQVFGGPDWKPYTSETGGGASFDR